MSARAGFFTAAYELTNQEGLAPSSLDHLQELLGWFRENLVIPKEMNSSRSKGAWRRHQTKGLSWFKSTAKIHLAKAYELADLLTRHGYHIEVLTSHRPGYVVYEDEFQLVAEPFADTVGA